MKKLIALTSALIAGSTFAALSNSANVSSAKAKPSVWQEIKERSSISYFGEFNDNSVNPDLDVEDQNQNFYYQSISARYKINDTWTARADLRFQTDEGAEEEYNDLNPRVGIQGVTYASGNFSVFTLFRVEGGVTGEDQDLNKMIKPKLYNAANYSLGANSLSVGLEFAKWLYQSGDENPANDGDITAMSNFMDFTYRYTFNDKATFQLYTELGLTSRYGKDLGDVTNTWERHLLGVDFSVAKDIAGIVKNVTIYPHVDYRPHNAEDKNIGDVGVGAWISAQFFQ